MKKLLIIILILLAAFLLRLLFLALSSQDMKPTLGLQDGKLTYCPQKPNCVSSQEEGDHFIKPIKSDLTMTEIKKRILELPRARIEKEGQDYIHFTFKSKIFGFLDDVELQKVDGVLHIRSASRVGYSDMEANRKRVERIRKLLTNS